MRSKVFPCPRCGSLDFVSTGKSRRCKVCGKYVTWVRKKDQKDWRQWNKGLTKETDERIADYGRKCSDTKKNNAKYHRIARENALKHAKVEGKFSPEQIQGLYDKLGSQARLAEYLNVSQSAVSLFMNKHGLRINSKSVGLKRQTEKQKKERYKKVSKSMKGNTNWRFSHQYPNKEEKKLIRFFKKWKLPFEYVGDGSFKIEGKCPDFVWKKKKVIIEFFGELWHEESDEPKRIKFFESHSWKCLVIWGKEIRGRLRLDESWKWEKSLYDKITRWLLSISP